jgi:hypothetical protein
MRQERRIGGEREEKSIQKWSIEIGEGGGREERKTKKEREA